jgi:hypothetical protein
MNFEAELERQRINEVEARGRLNEPDPPMNMTKLGERNYSLIAMGCKMTGTYDPNECLGFVLEDLYVDEIDEIIAFLNWVHITGRTFGHGNYEEVFHEWIMEKYSG